MGRHDRRRPARTSCWSTAAASTTGRTSATAGGARRLRMRGAPAAAATATTRRACCSATSTATGWPTWSTSGAGGVTIWINRSGNGWSDAGAACAACRPAAGPSAVTDLLGTGTGGVLWSRRRPDPPARACTSSTSPAGAKPRLLTEIDNQLGAVTRVGVRGLDRVRRRRRRPAGDPVAHHPAVPVPVVARVEVARRRSPAAELTTTYRYHHGYWDGVEREFRGFGRVEQVDTETFDDYHRGRIGRRSPPSALLAAHADGPGSISGRWTLTRTTSGAALDWTTSTGPATRRARPQWTAAVPGRFLRGGHDR